jgi:hypothetical protein
LSPVIHPGHPPPPPFAPGLQYESGGLFFPFVCNRILVAAAIMVMFTGCVLGIKRAWAQASLTWVVGLGSVYAFYA